MMDICSYTTQVYEPPCFGDGETNQLREFFIFCFLLSSVFISPYSAVSTLEKHMPMILTFTDQLFTFKSLG